MGGFFTLIDSLLEKCGHFFKKRPFFWADLARLGKWRTGGFGQIGVYRVDMQDFFLKLTFFRLPW